jgi:hypothetical protein
VEKTSSSWMCSALCWAQHNQDWTKPLRGKNRVDVQFVKPGDLSESLHVLFPSKPLCGIMESLPAANPSDKGPFQ